MTGSDWWSDSGDGGGVGDYAAQTGQAQNQLDPNTTYSPPGESAPIDQYNYVPDPNAPGGYQTYGPGQVAPVDMTAFSNQSGQYPNDQDMANAMANNMDLYPTISADGAANLGGYDQLPQQEQQSWQDLYGSSLAPYAWGQQTGNYNVPAAQQGFNSLPYDQQNIWYGTYGEQAPAIWAQQAAAAGGYGGQPPAGGGAAPPGNPAAGTAIPGGYQGYTNWGMTPVTITPSNYAGVQNPALAPGYIPGSGSYNQYNLGGGNLFGNIAGVMSNLNYGVGGPGDPTKGAQAQPELQTPEQWIQGGKLFEWSGNLGTRHNNGTESLDFIPTLYGRGDTPSGMSTVGYNAPPQYLEGLAQAIGKGIVKPTARGWQFLQEKGYTPQRIGGAAPEQAKSVGAGAGGANGPMGAGTQAFNYQAAYLDYMTARMNQLEIPGMNQLNDRERDKLAFEQAKQKWLEQYQTQVFGEGQRQFNELQGLRQGELVGQYNGQQTLASRAEQNQTSLGYLNLMSKMRGPGDMFQYLKTLQGTPGGIRDIVNAASGAYRMPGTGGGQVTVGGGVNTGGAADLNNLLGQINDPNYGAEAQNLNLPNPNQINALALQRMSPSQQQSLLAAYEAAGYNPQDVMAIFRNSLPQYAQQGGGQAGRVNLWGR